MRSLGAGMILLVPIVPRAHTGWALDVPLVVAGSGPGLLVSQLNNLTLSPIAEDRVSEAAGPARSRSGWRSRSRSSPRCSAS
jgi:hypothetical protein